MFRSSIKATLILPSVIVVVVTGLVVGGFSYVNGLESAETVARSLRSVMLNRVLDHLEVFFATPHTILKEDARLLRNGALDRRDKSGLQNHFLQQNIANGSFNSIYFGNAAGGLTGAGVEAADGSFYVTETREFRAGPFFKFQADAAGQPPTLLFELPDFDARLRPWYQAALDAEGGAWSDIYVLFTGHDMAITPSRAVRDEQGRVLGVVGGDIFLSGISAYLRHLHAQHAGQTFIMDGNGLLVASSAEEAPFVGGANGEPRSRLAARESATPEISAAAAALFRKFGSLSKIDRHQSAEYELTGERVFVDIAPFTDKYGLQLFVATILPEASYVQALRKGNHRTLFLVGISILIMGAVAAWMAIRISNPIRQLNESIDKMGRGDLAVRLETERQDEIGALARSFNDMAQALSRSFADIQERERRLGNQERFLSSIIDNLPNMVFVKEAENLTFVRVNKAAELLFGDKEANIIGKSDRDFFPESEAAFFISCDRDVLASKRALDVPAEPIDIPGVGRRILHTRKIGVYDSDGQPMYLLGISEDVTDRVEADRLLNQAKEEAEKANQAKSHFLATMSHDLRTPLNAILGFSDIVRRQLFGPVDNPRYLEYVEDIHSSGELLISLINDILDLSKVEAGKYEPSYEEIDLKDMADKCLHQLGPMASEAQVKLSVNIPDAFPPLICDRRALTQILNNLLSNAVKFTPQGGEAKIAASIGPDGAIVVSVKDNGIGMSDEDLAKTLEPFGNIESDKPREQKGTGLGLHICRRFMELFGGEIRVESILGLGTTVTLIFPAAASRTDEGTDASARATG